jgi:hypothetical protein
MIHELMLIERFPSDAENELNLIAKGRFHIKDVKHFDSAQKAIARLDYCRREMVPFPEIVLFGFIKEHTEDFDYFLERFSRYPLAFRKYCKIFLLFYEEDKNAIPDLMRSKQIVDSYQKPLQEWMVMEILADKT